MTSTVRWRTVLICLAAALTLLAVTTPATAAPSADGPTPLLDQVWNWFALIGQQLSGLDNATFASAMPPSMDPKEVSLPADGETLPSMDPTAYSTSGGGDEGETLPSMDPDG
jgi:hypothetical protein